MLTTPFRVERHTFDMVEIEKKFKLRHYQILRLIDGLDQNDVGRSSTRAWDEAAWARYERDFGPFPRWRRWAYLWFDFSPLS